MTCFRNLVLRVFPTPCNYIFFLLIIAVQKLYFFLSNTMLRKVLQQSLTRPANVGRLAQPAIASKRLFSVSSNKQQESESLKPTSGKKKKLENLL